jgi:uncharacterized protein (TIGR03067 family)
MKLSAVTAALLLVFGGPGAADNEKGLAPLCGEWGLTGTADARRADRGSPDCTMTIGAAGRVVLRIGEVVTNEGTVRVGRDGAARHIDLKLGTGLVLGVYQLNGDELTICCDEPGKARPDGLTPKGTQWVERWKRSAR